MTDQNQAKDLPDNLAELQETAAFKAVYKKFNTKGIKGELDKAGVTYGESDNKLELVWRYMDANNMPFDEAETEAEAEAEAETETEAEAEPKKKDPFDAIRAASNSGSTEQAIKDGIAQKQVSSVNRDNVVIVNNTGSTQVLETATSTLLPPGETTEIKATVYADKDKIIRNIKQMNLTRGNKLKILS